MFIKAHGGENCLGHRGGWRGRGGMERHRDKEKGLEA